MLRRVLRPLSPPTSAEAFILATENKVLRVFSMSIVNKQYICLISFGVLLILSAMILFVAHRDQKKGAACRRNAGGRTGVPQPEPELQEAQS